MIHLYTTIRTLISVLIIYLLLLFLQRNAYLENMASVDNLLTLLSPELTAIVTKLSTPQSLRSLLQTDIITREHANKEAFDIICKRSDANIMFSSRENYLLICEVLDLSSELIFSESPRQACQELAQMCSLLPMKEILTITLLSRGTEDPKLELVPVMLLIISHLLLTLPREYRKILSPTSLTDEPMIVRTVGNRCEIFPCSSEKLDEVCRKMPEILAETISKGAMTERYQAYFAGDNQNTSRLEMILLCQVNRASDLHDRLMRIVALQAEKSAQIPSLVIIS